MRRRTNTLLATFGILALSVWAGVSVEDMSAQESVRAEVRKALEEYVDAFSARRADLIAERSVLAPSTNISTAGVTASLTAADVKRRYESTLGGLAAQNYQRSQVTSANVCLLNDSAAIVSGRFTRYRTDGSVLSEIAATYVFAKSEGRWRIVTLINHATDRSVACN